MNTARDRPALAVTFGSGLAVLLLPKCPLCISAWLMALGVGAAVSLSLAELVVPAMVVVGVTAAAFVLVRRRRPAVGRSALGRFWSR